MKKHALIIMLALLLIPFSLAGGPPTKYDYLQVERQECGIVSCTTYYIATNPLASPVTIDSTKILKVSSVITYEGTPGTFATYYQNGNDWIDVSKIVSLTVQPAEKVRFKVVGNFIPVYSNKGQRVSYSIDHIPSFNSVTYPEYDLWNQSFNKCFYANVTIPFNNGTLINESFPLRLLLNSTVINTSAIRSDWGDLRFGAGMCENVTADYYHNFVYKNATNALAVIHITPATIRNNTVFRIVAYYNNTAATHYENPAASLGWGPSATAAPTQYYSNDKTTDTASNSSTAYNDTTYLYSFGNVSLTNDTIYGLSKKINNNQSGMYVEHNAQANKLSVSFTFTIGNTNQTGKQYLASHMNATDVTNTGVYELYYESIPPGTTNSYYDIHGKNLFTTVSTTECAGVMFNVTESVNLTAVSKSSSSTATRWLIYNGSYSTSCAGSPIKSGSFSGDIGTITGGQLLNSNQTYVYLIDSSGSSYTISFTASGDLPTMGNTSKVLYVKGISNAVVDNYIRNVAGLYFSTMAGGGGVSKNIVFKVYYSDGTKTITHSVPGIQNNTPYNIGFTIGEAGDNGKVTSLSFNKSSVYYRHESLAGYDAWRENATSCGRPGGLDICGRNTVFGGLASFNLAGSIYNMTSSLNGTIDEIIIAEWSPSNVSNFDKEFLSAWASTPQASFSPVLVSNIYAPTISLSLTPSDVSIADDANASVTYTDNDHNNGTVYLQWFLNGTNIRNATFQNVVSGSKVSNLLLKGNYTKDATLNVTAWANDSLYTTANSSIQVIIGGVRPNPITGLSCGGVNKTAIQCNWTNPLGDHNHTLILRNSSNVANVSNITTTYMMNGLFPGTSYNISLRTVSFDGTASNTTMNISSTNTNPAPNITSYTPSNLTPTFAENTTQAFNVTATDDDGTPFFTWLLDGVVQAVTRAWSWVIGLNDQGSYNVTVIVNDTYGASDSVSWAVTVTDDYPAPNVPKFTPDGGRYRTYIPVRCVSDNSRSSVSYYDIMVSVNGSAYENLSVNNRYGFIQYDITEFNYYSNFTFNCTAIGESGVTSGESQQFTKDYVNEFYASTREQTLSFTTLSPYTFSLYYDAQNPSNNVTVQYAYADCNGDKLYDYVYNYTGLGARRVSQSFLCAFPRGIVPFEIGVFIQKNAGDSWSGSGCSPDFDYSNTCLVRKTYGVTVQ